MHQNRPRRAAPGGPPVFIVGFPRSGTTLLRAMLDSHPELAIPPESHFIPLLWLVRRRYIERGRFNPEALLNDVFKSSRFREWGLNEDAVRRGVKDGGAHDFAGVIESLFLVYAHKHGKHRWGDKTPGYSLDMPLLADLFPSARFVHVVRDGRDVALSFLERFIGKDSRPAVVAEAWAHRIRRARADGAALGPNRYMEARYEELAADPAPVLRSVCEAIELEYRPEMLTYYERVSGSIPSREKQLHSNLLKPPTTGLRDWRSQMDAKTLRIFEAIAGAELNDLGYGRADPHPPASVQLRARAERLVVGLGHTGRSVRRRALRIARPTAIPLPRRW
jgi:sulfotransferase family protein